jgi:hypothetical protein
VQIVCVAAVFCAKVSVDGFCNSTGFFPLFFLFFKILMLNKEGKKKGENLV